MTAPKGYLACLSEAALAPEVQAIVTQSARDHSLTDTLRFYEIRNEGLVREIIQNVANAIDVKLMRDCEQDRLGKTSFSNAHLQAIAFAFICGAALAKEKKI